MIKNQQQHWNNKHKLWQLDPHSTAQTAFAEECQLELTTGVLLELGCGVGNDSRYFAKNNHMVIATDFSDEVIMRNEKDNKGVANLKFSILDTSSVPYSFENETFDTVYARLSLHYFDNKVTIKIFDEISRVLKPGGKICLMCKSTQDRLYGEGEEIETDMFIRDGHIRHFFSETYAKELLAKSYEIDFIDSEKKELYGKKSSYIKVIATRQ